MTSAAEQWGCRGAATHAGSARLLVDLSEVVHTDYGTGIHRVVRNLTRSLLGNCHDGWRCVPVAHSLDGSMRVAWDYAARALGVGPAADPAHGGFSGNDLMLLLDSAWEHPQRFASTIETMHGAGAKVGAVLYDLIPLRFPQHCVDFMQAVFEKWLRFVILHCDFIVCISRAVADDLAAWIGETGAATSPGLRIGHVRLGSDIGEGTALAAADLPVRQAMFHEDVVLMVGTVEPRKRHDLALAAFERCWAEGAGTRLVIIGKQGWHVEELAGQLRQHPELGRRLFWFEDVDNASLDHAYQHCSALLQASDAEGFGLPIVEAARHGKPLLLSDIAVFREIAGDAASYFTPGDVASLVECLGRVRRPTSGLLVATSWDQCAAGLLHLLRQGHWDHVIGN